MRVVVFDDEKTLDGWLYTLTSLIQFRDMWPSYTIGESGSGPLIYYLGIMSILVAIGMSIESGKRRCSSILMFSQ